MQDEKWENVPVIVCSDDNPKAGRAKGEFSKADTQSNKTGEQGIEQLLTFANNNIYVQQ
ncbi:MAG: hypothetical protein IJB80_06515 [Clostridia bacterium]|nr:hypothetical protein [Clostridia bacterium]